MHSTLPSRHFGARICARLLAVSLYLVLTKTASATLTDISFKSNNLSFINDTLINFTSPLAFTEDTGLDAPFLNSLTDSTISLGYGTYYAISFRAFGSHVGPGEISFRVNGGPLITQSVVFPDPTVASPVFALFSLPGGAEVAISATGLSADRIRIIANEGGLQPDGTLDAFYQFTYTGTAIPEPSASALLPGGLGLVWTATRRKSRREA